MNSIHVYRSGSSTYRKACAKNRRLKRPACDEETEILDLLKVIQAEQDWPVVVESDGK